MDQSIPGKAKDALQEGATTVESDPETDGAVQPFARTSPMNLVPRWTLTSDGVLQRSLDSGRTWQAIGVSPNATFRALAASGLNIWVGGASGSLYHSSDAGQHWMQVQPSVNGHALSADIIGVEFTDLQHGRLSTTSGEIWTTDDAGLSWSQR